MPFFPLLSGQGGSRIPFSALLDNFECLVASEASCERRCPNQRPYPLGFVNRRSMRIEPALSICSERGWPISHFGALPSPACSSTDFWRLRRPVWSFQTASIEARKRSSRQAMQVHRIVLDFGDRRIADGGRCRQHVCDRIEQIGDVRRF